MHTVLNEIQTGKAESYRRWRLSVWEHKNYSAIPDMNSIFRRVLMQMQCMTLH